jgi:hypothetical protein
MPSPNANRIARPADHDHVSLGGSYRRHAELTVVTFVDHATRCQLCREHPLNPCRVGEVLARRQAVSNV